MNDIKRAKLSDLTPDPHNANRGTQRGLKALDTSLRQYGAGRSILLDRDGRIIAGNKTAERAADIGLDDVIIVETDGRQVVAVKRTDLDLETDGGKARALATYDNRVGELDLDWDVEALGALDGDVLQELWTPQELDRLGVEFDQPPEPAEPQIDRAAELQAQWHTETGQMWRLPPRDGKGEHRLICGDCTDRAVVERVMGGERAALCHADPPYGMGKESEGIENDNLYREKLDAFQMQWWGACRPSLADNSSAYIWGNADDLWRLWYCGGLRDSERMTFRNEIVWEKKGAQGIASDAHRMYPTSTERALFFMLGEQGFGINADNYWDGWTPIVDYLESQRKVMGWSIKDTKRIAGHSEVSGCHWFDKSQWSMPTREVYEAWQSAARDYGGFKRDYDELKRDFYATRAYFDNAHENMTDIWNFGRVMGDERYGHATPKPIELCTRAIKSSCPPDALVLVPFNGTGPEIIAAENLHRYCRAVEISPGYVAVALQRYKDTFGVIPELVSL